MTGNEVFHLFSNTVAYFTALLFLRAALHKLADRYRFQGILADYAILPEKSLTAAAWTVPVLELMATVLLFMPTTRVLGAAMAGTLLTVYAIAMTISLSRGHYLLDCGCGGAPEPISWLLIARNTGLVGLVTPLAMGLVQTIPGSLLEDGASLGIATLLILLWLSAETMFSNARRMNDGLPSPTVTWSSQ